MKKILSIIITTLLIGSSVCLCSCNKNNEQNTTEVEATISSFETLPASNKTQDSTQMSTNKASGSLTLDDYINNDEVKSQLEKSMSAFVDTMSLDVFTENGDTIVYKYTYKEMYDISSLDTMKSTIDDSLEKQENIYNGMINDIKQITGIENVKIKLSYYLPDGTKVTEKTFEK